MLGHDNHINIKLLEMPNYSLNKRITEDKKTRFKYTKWISICGNKLLFNFRYNRKPIYYYIFLISYISFLSI